jgi:diguanylate cyclase (GGDEF)-like protein/PAS domain S-box-containing protein
MMPSTPPEAHTADEETVNPLTTSATSAASLVPVQSDQAITPELLSLFAVESDSAMLLAGADQRIQYANAGFTRMMGYAAAEVVGQRLIDVLAGRDTDPEMIHEIHHRVLEPGGQQKEVLAYTRAGRPLWISGMVNPVFDAAGRLLHVVYVLSDITLAKLHEVLQFKVLDAMLHEESVAEVMTLVCSEIERIAPDMLATVLTTGRSTDLTAPFSEGRLRTLAAPSLPAAYKRFVEALDFNGESLAPWFEERMIAHAANDPRAEPYRVVLDHFGLAACWVHPIPAKDGGVLGALVFYFRAPHQADAFQQRLVDLCTPMCALALERENTRAHIHQLAFYDGLTGLPNRRMLYTQAERELDEVALAVSTLAVLVIDLDRFKLVNDTQGHAAGDALLREVGNRLTRVVRGIDLVGRLAGDEFVAILPSCSVEHAAVAAERLLNAVAVPFALEGGMVNPGASIGVAMFPVDGSDVETLLRHADLAMAQAKVDGRNCSRFFNDDMNRVAQERVALETALRDALIDGQLSLHYQPQLHCKPGNTLYGVEALARWTHPRFGQVSPERFIPLAEECGLIGGLGDWALAESCRQLADWRRRGVAVPRVAVNLSAQNFQDAGLATRVADSLRMHGLGAEELTLEMTERAMLDSGDGAQATIKAVHDLGVHLSLDDFGTGYSSLSYLHRLPMKELKLDKSFVQDVSNSAAARSLIHSVMRIGDGLGLTVVAEGVETLEQFEFLRERGCAVVQGYLFAKPMLGGELEQWLAERLAWAPTI